VIDDESSNAEIDSGATTVVVQRFLWFAHLYIFDGGVVHYFLLMRVCDVFVELRLLWECKRDSRRAIGAKHTHT